MEYIVRKGMIGAKPVGRDIRKIVKSNPLKNHVTSGRAVKGPRALNVLAVRLALVALCVMVLRIPGLRAQIRVRPQIFDFGTVQEGIDVPVRFTLINTGKQSERIKEIRTFAACVESQPVGNPLLEPGDSLRLDYVFESLGYGGVAIDKKIEVYRDGTKAPLVLRVRGKVRAMEAHQVPVGEMAYNFFVLIDIRPVEDFRREHLIGAIHLPARRLRSWLEKYKERLSSEMVVYIYSGKGEESDRLAKNLREAGFRQCVSLVGGLAEWKRRYGVKWIVAGER
jgi:rhodanese-related sulfurtransferase